VKQIVSASRRTDIPAWYGEWFRRRLDEGVARYRTAFSPREHEVSLRPEDVLAFVFWTRLPRAFSPVLDRLDQRGFAYYFQYTVTGYPAFLERKVPSARSEEGLLRLAARLGPARVVWRYDPILFTAGLERPDHVRSFSRLASRFSGAVDTVMVSFLDRYRKVERRLRKEGISVRDPEGPEGHDLLAELHEIARRNGIRLVTCCEEAWRPRHVARGACIDAERLRSLLPAGGAEGIRPGPTRKECLCARSRDIGAYDTCLFDCVYCYAVHGRKAAIERRKAHRPEAVNLCE